MKLKVKNVKKSYLIALILLVGVFSACSNNNMKGSTSQKSSYTSIAPGEAKKRLESEKNIILLDVRTIGEYETGHIENSILIPVDTLGKEAEKQLKDKEVPIFVYCRSGNRSVTASKILVDLGYKNVYDLGGIKDWPYDIVR